MELRGHNWLSLMRGSQFGVTKTLLREDPRIFRNRLLDRRDMTRKVSRLDVMNDGEVDF